MILGYIMVGLGLTMFAGLDIAYPLYKKHINKKIDDKSIPNDDLNEKTSIYTQLFTNMGIMKKSDWIKIISYEDKRCYSLTKFVLSDSISLSSFSKKIDDIKNKLGVPFLEIYSIGKYMCFRCRKDNIPLNDYTFNKPKRQSLIPLGLDLDDNIVYWDLTKDPHIGIFAESGAGKSRFTHTIFCSILQGIPSAQHYAIDCKNGIELSRYGILPNVNKVARTPEEAKPIIAEIESISDKRYLEMEKAGYTDYNEYVKDKPRTNMKRIFVWIEEMADLVDDRKSNTKNGKVDGYDAIGVLIRLSRKLRACGITLICVTQRPTIDFIPASLKANLGCIIGMKVLNERNSQLIIDDNGLEELKQSQAIGKVSGDMVFFRSFRIDNKMINEIIKSCSSNDHLTEDVKEESNNTNVIDVDYQETPFK